MRRILLALLLVSSCGLFHAEDYTLGPDSEPHDGVPKGTLTKFVLAPGKDYPGTPHNCAVYVPAQYDASKPTPFMIFLDGSQALGNSMRVPVVLDNLIAKHDLPVMIAIFVDPGVLPSLSDADQNRYNRIFEYDSLTPRFADFLLDELIPEVGKQFNLSKNPDDRGLSGVSTGAVGAFMAAWNRPDQFHRVLSLIGTYVAMKGADALPALVRRTEPKPIRIFMQDGTADHITAAEPYGTHFSGSWPINNQVMYEALEFAGYDVKLALGTEGHNLKQGGAILPDALRWLWRDYPAPVVVHEPAAAHEPLYDTADRVFSTVYVDKPWQRVGGDDSFDHDDGQIWSLTSDANGNAYICGGNTVERVDADGNVTQFLQLKSGVGRVRYGADGRWFALVGTDEIVSFHKTTGPPNDLKIIARGLGIYDFVVAKNGTIYFIDARMGIRRIDAAGKIDPPAGSGVRLTPNGLALSPDQSMLVVTDAGSGYSWSFQIAPDGSLVNGEPFYRLELPELTESRGENDVHGAVEDTDGNVYFATPLGIQVSMQNGRISQILNSPIPGGGPLSAITFAGSGDQSWLYAAQDGKLFRRPVKVTGANAWTVVKPPKPTL